MDLFIYQSAGRYPPSGRRDDRRIGMGYVVRMIRMFMYYIQPAVESRISGVSGVTYCHVTDVTRPL